MIQLLRLTRHWHAQASVFGNVRHTVEPVIIILFLRDRFIEMSVTFANLSEVEEIDFGEL